MSHGEPHLDRRKNRVEDVQRVLLQQIESGELAIGDRLPTENALAKQNDVSRPVIREAIARLVANGLVRTERGKGSFVQPVQAMQSLTLAPIRSIDDLLGWQELRIAIEQEAGRLAATRRSAEDLEKIVEINDALVLLEDGHSYGGELDNAFHVAIAAATHNQAILEAQKSLGNHTKQWISTVLHTAPDAGPDRNEYRLREHMAIIDSIARMDPDGTAQSIRRHIENGRTRFLARLSRRHSSGEA